MERTLCRGFDVSVCKKTVVKMALPPHEFWLPVSNIDLMLPPLEFCVFFFYKPSNFTHTSSAENVSSVVALLKSSLAETLVPYYALAGEIATNNLGEPELLCNNRGVEFFEAYADVELDGLNLHKLEENVFKLVPDKKQGVMAVQATQLKCRSLVVSCLFDHRVADAYSANLFFVSWAEAARSEPISVVPSFRRSLLGPRRPLQFNASIEDMYMPLSSLSPQISNLEADDNDKLLSRLYYIEAEKINGLQALASSNGSSFTKLESFSAFLWKLVAKSARKSYNAKRSTVGIIVDGRKRIGGDEMACYFGNVITGPFNGQEVNDVVEKPLHWAANEVHSSIKKATTEEHFLSLVDWIESHRPNIITPKVYWVDDGPAVNVSSGQRFPVTEIDFGWGPPALGFYSFPQWGGKIGYVMPVPSAAVDGDWVVYMNIRKTHHDVIAKEAADVFRPMTSGYFNNFDSVSSA